MWVLICNPPMTTPFLAGPFAYAFFMTFLMFSPALWHVVMTSFPTWGPSYFRPPEPSTWMAFLLVLAISRCIVSLVPPVFDCPLSTTLLPPFFVPLYLGILLVVNFPVLSYSPYQSISSLPGPIRRRDTGLTSSHRTVCGSSANLRLRSFLVAHHTHESSFAQESLSLLRFGVPVPGAKYEALPSWLFPLFIYSPYACLFVCLLQSTDYRFDLLPLRFFPAFFRSLHSVSFLLFLASRTSLSPLILSTPSPLSFCTVVQFCYVQRSLPTPC